MSQARVSSIQAIRDFRATLVKILAQVNDSLGSVNLESRRSLEWILERQPEFWKAEIRRCQDNVLQAKNDLHRCRSSPLPGGDTPSCMEEKKALQKAQDRLKHAEEKAVKTRQWGATVQREVIEYDGRANQLAALLDGTMPQAVAYLDQALAALDAYLATGATTATTTSGGGTGPMTRPAEDVGDRVETAEDRVQPPLETVELQPPAAEESTP